MNHEVTKAQPLLDKSGKIAEEGWARKPIWNYERKKIKANALRIKEWDYYSVTSASGLWSLNATISDLGFGALFSISFIDYRRKAFSQEDAMKFFTFGKMNLTPSSKDDHNIQFSNEKMRIAFSKRGTKRILLISAPDMILPDKRKGIDAKLELTHPEDLESMNIATSWAEKRTAFYLNEKVNCMEVNGTVRMGEETITLPKNDCWGVLDWGRGRWTYTNRWYWGSGSGLVEGKRFGFNIGYGFSDRTPASENVIFYDGKVHKFDLVEFHIPKDSYTSPWRFTSNDGRFEMDFEPAVDRASTTNFVIIKSVQHQVFGYFSGKAVLDDGTVIKIEKFPAFAEDVFNRW